MSTESMKDLEDAADRYAKHLEEVRTKTENVGIKGLYKTEAWKSIDKTEVSRKTYERTQERDSKEQERKKVEEKRAEMGPTKPVTQEKTFGDFSEPPGAKENLTEKTKATVAKDMEDRAEKITKDPEILERMKRVRNRKYYQTKAESGEAKAIEELKRVDESFIALDRNGKEVVDERQLSTMDRLSSQEEAALGVIGMSGTRVTALIENIKDTVLPAISDAIAATTKAYNEALKEFEAKKTPEAAAKLKALDERLDKLSQEYGDAVQRMEVLKAARDSKANKLVTGNPGRFSKAFYDLEIEIHEKQALVIKETNPERRTELMKELTELMNKRSKVVADIESVLPKGETGRDLYTELGDSVFGERFRKALEDKDIAAAFDPKMKPEQRREEVCRKCRNQMGVLFRANVCRGVALGKGTPHAVDEPVVHGTEFPRPKDPNS